MYSDPSAARHTISRRGPVGIGLEPRQGGKPWGRVIDDTFRAEFTDGKVILSATGFLRIHKRSGIKGNRQSFWFEEMKLPPLK